MSGEYKIHTTPALILADYYSISPARIQDLNTEKYTSQQGKKIGLGSLPYN